MSVARRMSASCTSVAVTTKSRLNGIGRQLADIFGIDDA